MKFAKVNSTKKINPTISRTTKISEDEDMESSRRRIVKTKHKFKLSMKNTRNTPWKRKTKVIKQVFKLQNDMEKSTKHKIIKSYTSLLKLNSYQIKSRFEHFSSTSLLGEELPTSKRSTDLEDTNNHRVTLDHHVPFAMAGDDVDGVRGCLSFRSLLQRPISGRDTAHKQTRPVQLHNQSTEERPFWKMAQRVELSTVEGLFKLSFPEPLL